MLTDHSGQETERTNGVASAAGRAAAADTGNSEFK